MLVTTVAILTIDLSYARSIGKSRASAVISLPTQRHFRPVGGSPLSTRNVGIKILSQIIRTPHNSKFRRAVLDETPEQPGASSEELPIDAPEPPANFLGTNLPMEASEETPVDEYQYRYHGQGDSFALEEDGRRRFIEGEEYAATLPPIGSEDSMFPSESFGSIPTSFTLDPLIPRPLSLDNLIYNLNPPLRTDSGETGISPQTVVNPVPKDSAVPKDSKFGTKVGPPATDHSSNGIGATNQGEANTVNSKTAGKPSSTEGETSEPETSTGDQKEDKSNISEEKANAVLDAGTGPSKDADKSPDVAVEGVKSDGTPVIIKIYLNQRPGDKGAKEYEIVRTTGQEPSDEEVPPPPNQESKAGIVAEPKSEPTSDDESKKGQTKNADEDVQLVSNEKPTSPKSAQQPSTGLEKEGTTEKPKGKTAKEHPSPERKKHGDYLVFRLTGADQDDKISTTPPGTGNSQLAKTTLPADVVDLITWNGDPGKQPPDVSSPNPRLAQGYPRTRMFRL